MNFSLLTKLVISTIIFSIVHTSPLLGQQGNITERWLGIHNGYFQNKKILNVHTTTLDNDRTLITTVKDYDKNFSFGFNYRLINKNKTFHQFDVLLLDLTRTEDLKEVKVVDQLIEPTSGMDVGRTKIRIGYRLGKMLAFHQRFTAEASAGAYPTYERVHTVPVRGANFPFRNTKLGLGLDLRLGLNYQIHRRINIGYSIAPFTGQWFWHREYADNPILTEKQKITETFEMDTYFFDNVLDFRNISIRYVMPTKEEKRKKRRRR